MSTKVYIKLLNEGTDVWRLMEAQEIGNGIFQILGEEGYDPEDEEVEFVPGTKVYCELQKKSGGEVLVAIKKL